LAFCDRKKGERKGERTGKEGSDQHCLARVLWLSGVVFYQDDQAYSYIIIPERGKKEKRGKGKEGKKKKKGKSIL